jgi:hypothetical protein
MKPGLSPRERNVAGENPSMCRALDFGTRQVSDPAASYDGLACVPCRPYDAVRVLLSARVAKTLAVQ